MVYLVVLFKIELESMVDTLFLESSPNQQLLNDIENIFKIKVEQLNNVVQEQQQIISKQQNDQCIINELIKKSQEFILFLEKDKQQIKIKNVL